MRRRARLAVILVAGALAACRPAVGTPTAPRQDATTGSEAAEGEERRRFLALYFDDQQVGGVETVVRTLPDGSVVVQDRFMFAISRVNAGSVDDFSVESHSRTEYAPDRSLRFEESVKTEAGVVEKTVTKIEGDGLVLAFEGPGQAFEKRFVLPPDFRSSRAVYFELLERFEASGGPVQASYKSFSTDEQRFVDKTMRVTQRRTVRHGKQSIVAFDVVEESDDGAVVQMVADHDYLPLSLDMFGTLTARWVDESPFEIDTIAKITSEIPVKGNIPNWWELEAMQLTFAVEGDDPKLPSLFADSHYHRVEREGSTYEIELHNTRPPGLDGTPELPLSAPDPTVARFLAPTPLSQSDDPAIRSAAREIVGEERNALLAGVRIVHWVYENLEKKGGVRGSATATEVLAARAGDCTEHAALTVALARAAGLPARNVDGIVFLGGPDGDMLAGYHAWSEIWIGRWIAVDAVFAEVGTTARYLAFGYNEPGEHGAGASLSRTVGKTSITIDGYKLFGAEPVRLRAP